MKTIFVTCQLGQELRDFMVGTFYHEAKSRPDVRLVVFAPEAMVADMREKFSHERCVIEPLITAEPKGIFANIFFKFMASYPMIPTRTIFIRQMYAYRNGGNVFGFILKRVLWLLGHFSFARHAVRWIWLNIFSDDKNWKSYFDTYKPDVVFGTSGFRWWDFTILAYAKKNKIPTVLMLRSWDNLSTKAFLFIHPDKLLVQNPVMVEEAMVWHDIPKEKIFLVGSPPYDHFIDPSWKMTREEVAKKIGIDVEKQWIGYFSGPLFDGILECKDKGEHIAMVGDAISRGNLSKNTQIVASIHPDNRSVFAENQVHCPVLNLVKGWNFNREQSKLIMNFMRECAVIMHFGSTISLDAAILDTPIVMLGFNGKNSDVPVQKSLSFAFDNTLHMQYLLRTGGMTRVSNEQELIDALDSYIGDRSRGRLGRARVVHDLVGPVDGFVGKRILNTVLS